MRLIGMLDSPYVRRVAIALDMLDAPFAHESVSVFTDFERFRSINAVVKAPTLICDDGEVLMDSSLILQYIEATIANDASLWPRDARELQHDMRAVCLALAACDKGVQWVYERNLRPAAMQYEPWLERVAAQIAAAFAALEFEVQSRCSAFQNERSHAAIMSAIAWQMAQSMFAQLVATDTHPQLAKLSARMEQTSSFLKYPPLGPGVPAT